MFLFFRMKKKGNPKQQLASLTHIRTFKTRFLALRRKIYVQIAIIIVEFIMF